MEIVDREEMLMISNTLEVRKKYRRFSRRIVVLIVVASIIMKIILNTKYYRYLIVLR